MIKDMQRYFFRIVILFVFLSCDRYPDPSYKILERYSFRFENQSGQKYFAGETFKDTIKYRVTHQVPTDNDPVKVVFKIVSGGGTLSADSVYTDNKGIAATNWKLGSESFEQVIRASSYDPSGKYLTSTDFTAFAFRKDAWDTYSSSSDGSITGMVTDTIHGITLMVTNSHLYRQGSRYYIWEEIVHPNLVSPRTIDIDRNGIVYVGTWKGEVVKSADQGKTWSYCTKPYPDNPYYLFMYVSNDNYIWVSKFDYPTVFSRDGGNTWITAGSALNSTNIGDVFRLKNGSILFCTSACCFILRSNDDGSTWTRIETPAHSNKLFVNEKDEIFVCGQENGVFIYMSTDMGATFRSLYGVSVSFRTTMDNVFNKWKGIYYIQIPGYGILKSTDLIHYEEYFPNNNLDNLFIDHNGVLIAKKWNSATVYYRQNTH